MGGTLAPAAQGEGAASVRGGGPEKDVGAGGLPAGHPGGAAGKLPAAWAGAVPFAEYGGALIPGAPADGVAAAAPLREGCSTRMMRSAAH
jgi:hypothetical protein